MKKIILFLIIFTCIKLQVVAQTDIYREGNIFVKQENKTVANSNKTVYTYKYKDKIYPIYISKNGHCYIIRISKNGNEYKQYLDEEISRQICKELGIEYKTKSK